MKNKYEFDKARNICESRKEAHVELYKSSDVYKDLMKKFDEYFDEKHFNKKRSKTDLKTNSLIAVAMAISSDSESMIEWAVTRALNNKIERDVIREVFDLGLIVFGGKAVSAIRFGYNVINLRIEEPSS